MKSGVAVLEEWLQQKYVEYYDEADNYNSKPELLAAKISNLLLKDGTKNYITYDGNIYYLINKQSLPDEVKEQLISGDTTQYSKYIRLYDVYGVTNDLKVYYCDSSGNNTYGIIETNTLDPNTPVALINNNAGLKDTIKELLASKNITVDETVGITVGNLSKISTLTLDGSQKNITSLSGISELKSLKTLTLSNLNVSNLSGIESCSMLNYIYFDNCEIADFSALAQVITLKYLYVRLPNAMSEETANTQIANLSAGLRNASDMNTLKYFGIFGTSPVSSSSDDATLVENYTADDKKVSYSSQLTNIEGLGTISSSIQNSVEYMYLNNNNLSNVKALEKFTKVCLLNLNYNKNLQSLEGLENHNSINYLGAIYCNLQSLNGLKGTTGIKYITISNNSNLQNLAGLEKDKLLETIYASDCDITDISMLNYTEDGTSYAKTALTSIKLENNSNLSDIKSIKVCSKITSCYLKGSGELDTTVLSSTEFQTIIKKCGIRYSLDDVYSLLFLNSEKVSLTDSYGVLTDEKLELLRGKTNIKSLDLSNQGSLSNEKLVSVLGSLTGLNCLKLYNVTGLTSVSFMSELKYLIELDLRGTSVTDLSPLETLAEKEKLPLGCLIIDNDGIHVYDIQKTISSVCEKYTGTDFSLNKDGGALPKGFILSNNKNFSDFAQCENIKYFRVYNTIAGSSGKTSDLVSGTIDLRNCLELYIVGTRAYNATFLLPKTLKYYSGENYYTPNLSGNDSMIDFHVSWSGCDLSSVMYDLRNDSQLMYFSANWLWGNASLTNIACLNNTKVTNLTCYSMTGLKGISLDEEVPKITEIDFHSSSKFNSLEGFNYFTNLVALNMNDTIISSLQPLSDLKSLATLKIENTKVNSLSPLLNCTSLVTINSSGTQLSDLNGVQKLTALQTLDVSNNESISNLYYLKLLLENNETISLKTLNLSGCNLENGETITVDGEKVYVDNLQIIKALKAKGLENIDISYNNITDEETLSEIAGLGWKSCNISHQGE